MSMLSRWMNKAPKLVFGFVPWVLIVEDDALDIEAIKRSFHGRDGFLRSQILAVPTIDEAIRIAKTLAYEGHYFDLVFMDVRRSDGDESTFETDAERLRYALGSKPKYVAMSGQAPYKFTVPKWFSWPVVLTKGGLAAWPEQLKLANPHGSGW